MEQALAYVCCSAEESRVKVQKYCRKIYELGYVPICPRFVFSPFLEESDAEDMQGYGRNVTYPFAEVPDGSRMWKRSDRNNEYRNQYGRQTPYHLYDTRWTGTDKRIKINQNRVNPVLQKLAVLVLQA